MHVFDVLGHPVRRSILETLLTGPRSSGDLVHEVGGAFGITQPAVSQHLRVLRDHGFASVEAEGTRRIYTLLGAPLEAADVWLGQFRPAWERRLDALETEVARGKRDPRPAGAGKAGAPAA